jgi:hypothetical protein
MDQKVKPIFDKRIWGDVVFENIDKIYARYGRNLKYDIILAIEFDKVIFRNYPPKTFVI